MISNGDTNFHHKLFQAIRNSLFVFWACGTYSLLLDSDHFIRCLPNISWQCAIDSGIKPFHGWIGFGLGIYFGLLCTCFAGRLFGLVGNTTGPTNDNHKVTNGI
jgi:hypothetical protein